MTDAAPRDAAPLDLMTPTSFADAVRLDVGRLIVTWLGAVFFAGLFYGFVNQFTRE